MANEINGVASWIESKLVANTTVANGVGIHPRLRIPQIYEVIAPAGATTPYVVYTYRTGRDLNGVSGYRVLAVLRYDIEVIIEGESYASQIPKGADGADLNLAAVNTAAIADAIDATLHQGQDVVDPIVIGAQSIAKIQFSEIVGARRMNHLGSKFEIMAYYQAGQ